MFDEEEETQFETEPEYSSYKWTWANFWANVFRGFGSVISGFGDIFTNMGDDLVAHSNFREEERVFQQRAGMEIEALTRVPAMTAGKE